MKLKYIDDISRLLLLLGIIQMAVPVWANNGYERVYDGHAHRQVHSQKNCKGKSWKDKFLRGIKSIWHEPVVKKGAIGAGIGVGAATIAEENLLKSGLVGADVGAEWAILDDSKIMERQPF
jgi:hypothetical protein